MPADVDPSEPTAAAGADDTAARPASLPLRSDETRTLPSFRAGEKDIPHGILGTAEDLDRDTTWAQHSHPTHELLWNARGVGTATIDPRTWTITPNLGLWIPAGHPHHGRAPAGTRLRAAQFRLHTATLGATVIPVAITPLLRLLLDRLREPDLGLTSREITEAMILDLLEPAEGSLVVHRPEHPLLQPIVDALQRDPGDATSLEQWACHLGVSSRTLTRTFESSTGHAFRPWVARVRAQRAITLLAAGTGLDEVSRQVGYRSPSAFIAAFKRLTGTTPTRFRSA